MARFKYLRAEAEERFLRLHVKAWTRAATFAGGNLVRFWRMADSRWWQDFDAVLAAAVPAGSRILDVGCGDGGLVDRLAELGFDVLGVDPAAPSHPRLVPVRVEDARLLGEFDAVAAVMALHHADLNAVVGALANLLRPRGSAWLAVSIASFTQPRRSRRRSTLVSSRSLRS